MENKNKIKDSYAIKLVPGKILFTLSGAMRTG
jgi:hypothetical protein